MAESTKNSAEQPKKKKLRSPNYPKVSIEKALILVGKQHQSDGLQAIPANIAHERWGYAPNQSRAQLREAALKAYGLIEVLGLSKSRTIRVTERADRIIRQHPDCERIIKEAALSPTIYREVWERYEGNLPQDDVLRQFLVWEKGFNDKSVSGFISQFRETISFAKLEEGDILEQSTEEEQPGEKPDDRRFEASLLGKPQAKGSQRMEQLFQQPTLRELKFLLPSGEAVLFLPQQMTERDFSTLDIYLNAVKGASVSGEVTQSEDELDE